MSQTSAFEIRRYVDADQPDLLAVINAICAEGLWTYTDHFQPTPAWLHAFAEPGCSCHCLLVVETADKAIIGWCELFPNEDATATLGIGLLVPFRNQGLGKRLLACALTWATRQLFDKVTLIVRKDNARAIHLYHHFGFQLRGAVIPPVPAVGEWIEMVRFVKFSC